MAERKRDQAILVRVSVEERAMLEALTERTGLSQSDILRQCVRKHYREEFGTEPPGRRKRPRR